MKASMTLKPLVFAIAAAMAIAAQASEQSNRHRNHDPLLDRSAGDATATVERDQYVGDDNTVTNQGTENTTDVSDSLNGNNGNVGANFASGTMNQQANDVVIATADEDFVFGTATASVAIGQENNGSVAKVSNVNSVVANGFGNDTSGNVGINMASGDLNQQANALAIATARGWEVTANGGGYQDMTGNTVDNKASGAVYQNKFEFTKDFENNYEQHKSSDANFSASRSEEEQSASSKTAAASYTAHFDSSKTANKTYSSSLDASLDASESHTASSESNHNLAVDATASASLDLDVDVDRDRNGFEIEAEGDASLAVDVNVDKSSSMSSDSTDSYAVTKTVDKDSSYSADKTRDWNKEFAYDSSESEESSSSSSKEASKSWESNKDVVEVGSGSLATSVTFTRSYTYLNPVTNTVTMSDALNGASGNLGVNIAAGTSNQQMNSMTIAVGCDTCNE